MISFIKQSGRVALNLTAYPLSGLFPRSERTWVFGHMRDLFAGNPKYLYLWLSIHRPDIEAVWLTGNEKTRRILMENGYRACRRWSPAGVRAALRAKVYVTAHGADTINPHLCRGAFILNLWHGVGLKAVHLGHKTGMVSGAALRARNWFGRLAVQHRLLGYDMVATTSDLMQRHFSEQFQIPEEFCPQLGYPRLDVYGDAALKDAAMRIDRSCNFAFNPGGFDEIYLYVPTFRDTGRPFLEAALPDFDRLSAVLRRRNALLYLKPHLRTDESLPVHYDNIRRWPDAIDLQTYLGDLTGLITDYSSVLYDYLFVKDSGAILYTFDFESYASGDRVLLYPYEENVAGTRVSTFEELCAVLASGAALERENADETARIRERFWGGSPSPSSAAVVDYVERKIREDRAAEPSRPSEAAVRT